MQPSAATTSPRPFTFTSGVQSNYNVQLNTAVKGLIVLYRWDGFLQPINDTAHDLGPMSKFKAGQTIPAKFVLKNAAGAVVQQTGIPTFTRTDVLGACDSTAASRSGARVGRRRASVQVGRQPVSLQLEHEGTDGGPVSHLRQPRGWHGPIGGHLPHEVGEVIDRYPQDDGSSRMFDGCWSPEDARRRQEVVRADPSTNRASGDITGGLCRSSKQPRNPGPAFDIPAFQHSSITAIG